MAEYIEKSGLKKSMSALLSVENVPCNIRQLVLDIIDGEMLADVQPANGWISCKDELPLGCDVLVYYNQGYVDIGYYGIGAWYIRGNSFEEVAVSHWQPLPELPKKGRKY